MRPPCGSRVRAQVRKHDWIVDTHAACRGAAGGEPLDISSLLLIFLLLNLIAGGGRSSSAARRCAFHLVLVFTSTQAFFALKAISDWKWFLAVEPIATRCENNHDDDGRKPTRDWIPRSRHLDGTSFKKESENDWLLKHTPPPPDPNDHPSRETQLTKIFSSNNRNVFSSRSEAQHSHVHLVVRPHNRFGFTVHHVLEILFKKAKKESRAFCGRSALYSGAS